MDHQKVIELARTQRGCLTRRQAFAVGATDQRIRSLVDSGIWQRARPGVFVVGAIADSWDRTVMAACLAAGDDAMGSHRTAARIWGLVDWSGRIQVLVAGRRRVRLPGVEVHRSLLLPPMDRTTVRQIPVTSMARTIIDLAASQDRATLAAWIDQGMRERQLQIPELQCCLARLAGPGRPRFDGLEALIAQRLPGYDAGESALESLALRVLRAAGLPDPVRQHPVRRPGGQMAYLDLAYPDRLVGIELDGWAYHGQRGAFDRDRDRRNDLTLLGWSMFHFTSTTPGEVLVATVRRALDRPRVDPGC